MKTSTSVNTTTDIQPAAFEVMSQDYLSPLPEKDFILSLGHVLDSPHVKVDPAARIVYYCMVFYGHVLTSKPKSPTTARNLYLRCLRAVPSWQASASPSMMDAVAATVLVRVLARNLDSY